MITRTAFPALTAVSACTRVFRLGGTSCFGRGRSTRATARFAGAIRAAFAIVATGAFLTSRAFPSSLVTLTFATARRSVKAYTFNGAHHRIECDDVGWS
mmetsp:Transcript_9498/g.13247  ORF Transcript_9498/g.13247 Transcript_9498/m.13247 type:complete len:99 (-) Transcript_9498:277-573(-)